MIGLDTGFFVELLRGNPDLIKVWQDILDGNDAVVSCMSIFELKKLGLKGTISRNDTNTLVEAIMAICRVVWIDNLNSLETAVKLSYGLGIPAVDAQILAAFVKHNADSIYTTDAHMAVYKKKGVKIILISI
ncbi:MAG: type II toxin-antitoxin system VapC family toxin [Deltaproteobacteria bacterium]|nr:type II toxin-antitoxin system VapC family toxin [Deltaproteobacteria bacterium]